jgi:glycolate oxidase FAD binding subunit
LSTASTNLAEQLREIVGPEHVTSAPELDADGVRPLLTVAPGTPEETARVLAAAQTAGAAVAPWGGGTKQRLGPPPTRLDLVLYTHRLNAVIEWEPADLTAALQAGMTLGAAQELLAQEGQQIAVEAPVPARATLGGLAATNTAGPRRWLAGGWRDLVVGMSMALANGTVIKTGGRVVKNVQGYDLAKLFIGSLGTLGVITQVNVRLVPLPPVRRLLVARGELTAVATFLDAVAASQARVSTIDVLDEAAARACGLGSGGYTGLVLIEGDRTVVDAQITALHQLAGPLHLATVEGDALAPVWQTWVHLSRVDDLASDEALFTIHTRPSDVPEALRVLVQEAEALGQAVRSWAHAGNGIVYGRVSGNAIPTLHTVLLARWPATTLVAGDPAVERASQPWGVEPEGLPLMRALKRRFDPAGVFQPGRYVGGI